MKKSIFSIIVGLSLVMSGVVFAQGMMGGNTTNSDDHTAQEEAEGRVVWEKLQARELECANLSDENFEALGEYFMGIMMGDSHAAMNTMIVRMHGEEGEEQIHIVMGKRLSGCDTSAAFPEGTGGWMPIINMMWGGWSFDSAQDRSSPFGFNQKYNSMMSFGFMPFGWFGWIFMILWWALVIIGILALIKWLTSQSSNVQDHEKSPLDILKERYAKGEIDKKEFEEKSREIKNL